MKTAGENPVKEKKRRRAAWYVAGVFHGLLLLLFLMVSWKEPYPLPEPKEVEMIEFDFSGGSGSPGGSSATLAESTTEAEEVPEEEVITNDKSEVEVPNNPVKNPKTPKTPEEKKPAEGSTFGGNSNSGEKGNSTGSEFGDGKGGTGGGNDKGNGKGKGDGDGSGVSMNGRKQVGFPMPNNPNLERGKVVFAIWVNKAGIVTRCALDQVNSTATDAALVKACKDELIGKQIVNADDKAAAEQKGVYVFEFNVR